VFIGNIPLDCRESDLEDFFRGIGEIRDVVLKQNYGFCEFVDYYDARDAVKEKDGERLLGARVRVELARGERSGGGAGGGGGSSRPAERNCCVYMGNVAADCREDDIEDFFYKFGKIRQVMIKRGYAFATFEDERDAEDAVRELNGKKLLGERVRLEFAKGERRGSDRDRDSFRGAGASSGGGSNYRVRVENLASNTAWQDLKDYMKQAGEVSYCKAHDERPGEGMVEFQRKDDMEWALDKLDGTELDGRRLRLSQEVGRGGGGGGRSRSRSRSRSPRPRGGRSRSRT